jgi:hypothetical protein
MPNSTSSQAASAALEFTWCSFSSSSEGTRALPAMLAQQAYLCQQAWSSSFAPSMPEVYGVFDNGDGSTYLVTEHISAPSFRAWIDIPGLSDQERQDRAATAVAAIARAIAWLLACPLPDGDMIGPVGGGHIQHSFFGMEEAPVPFVNATALEKYVNTVCPHPL